MSNLAPICLFTYNRLDETKRTVEALLKNYLSSQSELYVFSDGAKNENDKLKIEAVRTFLKKISGFKSVIVHESLSNKGLANSIISGVTQVLNNHDRVIVLEDDLIASPNFLNFMNQTLSYYKNSNVVQTVCGFSVAIENIQEDVYFQRRPFSWGWATWSEYWDRELFDKEKIKKELQKKITLIDDFKKDCGNNMGKMLLESLDNKNNSWFVLWAFNQYINKNYSVIPTKSFVQNIGFGVDGTHCKGINPYRSNLINTIQTEFKLYPFKSPDTKLTKQFLKYFTLKHKIYVRIRLLKNREGRSLLMQEFKKKLT
jgi:GT2 family glycosyltransferase